MIRSGNHKRLIIDAFITAGITVIAVNAYLLTYLFDLPIAEKSEGLKRASVKWQQLTDSTGIKSGVLSEKPDIEKIIVRLEPPVKSDVKPQERKPGDDAQKAPAETPLPHLTGVLQVTGPGKHNEFTAVMEGKKLHKNDKIMDFTVINITSEGVLLAGKGQQRFIPAPNLFFSVRMKEERSEAKSR
jgi:hypothetical protein